jgi:hypothetical protein
VISRLRDRGYTTTVSRQTTDGAVCAEHSRGQVRAWFVAHPCTALGRARLEVEDRGHATGGGATGDDPGGDGAGGAGAVRPGAGAGSGAGTTGSDPGAGTAGEGATGTTGAAGGSPRAANGTGSAAGDATAGAAGNGATAGAAGNSAAGNGATAGAAGNGAAGNSAIESGGAGSGTHGAAGAGGAGRAGSVALAVAWVRMPDEAAAAAVKALLDRPGSGDVEAMGGDGPPAASFDGLHYASALHGSLLVVAEAVPGGGDASDGALRELLAAAVG